jgi:hypothetical protein
MNHSGCNTFVHGSNARNLCIAILISTSKNTLSFLILLMCSLQQNWRKGQNRFFLEEKRGGGLGGGCRGWG